MAHSDRSLRDRMGRYEGTLIANASRRKRSVGIARGQLGPSDLSEFFRDFGKISCSTNRAGYCPAPPGETHSPPCRWPRHLIGVAGSNPQEHARIPHARSTAGSCVLCGLFDVGVSIGAETKPLVTKAFSVADLVIPIPDLGDDPGPIDVKRQKEGLATNAGKLVKQVTVMVRPCSWDAMGGAGKIEFFENEYTLVVFNTAEAIAEVGDFLEALRRLQDISVATEVRIVSVPAGFCERVGVKPDGGALSPRELKLFLEAAQGHREANVMQLPKVTTFDGQTATIRAGERRSFVTGGELVKVKGQPVFVPKNKDVDLGDTLTLCGRVSADRRFVDLRAKLARTTLVGEVEMIPVTTMVTPVFEGGARGKPIPFTQFLQAPELKTQSVEKSIVLPTGGTVVLGGWTESNGAWGSPVLSKVPHVNKLYKNVGEARECEVVVLATSNIVQADAECRIQAPTPRESQR